MKYWALSQRILIIAAGGLILLSTWLQFRVVYELGDAIHAEELSIQANNQLISDLWKNRSLLFIIASGTSNTNPELEATFKHYFNRYAQGAELERSMAETLMAEERAIVSRINETYIQNTSLETRKKQLESRRNGLGGLATLLQTLAVMLLLFMRDKNVIS